MMKSRKIIPSEEPRSPHAQHGSSKLETIGFFVTVPPKKKLGIHLVNALNTNGTVVSMVNNDSPLADELIEGDRIIQVNGIDVRRMNKEGAKMQHFHYFHFAYLTMIFFHLPP